MLELSSHCGAVRTYSTLTDFHNNLWSTISTLQIKKLKKTENESLEKLRTDQSKSIYLPAGLRGTILKSNHAHL